METQISKKFDSVTRRKVVKGAIIAGGGAFITYILQYISAMDFGPFLTPIIVAISGIAINTTQEYFAGIRI